MSYHIRVNTRGEANQVILEMKSRVKTYTCVTVEEVNTLLGLSSAYEDSKSGWVKVDEPEIKRTGSFITVVLPSPVPLN